MRKPILNNIRILNKKINKQDKNNHIHQNPNKNNQLNNYNYHHIKNIDLSHMNYKT